MDSAPVYGTTVASLRGDPAYELRVSWRGKGLARLNIMKDGEPFLQWSGRVAERLLESLPDLATLPARAHLSKQSLKDLALRAAAVEIQLAGETHDEPYDKEVAASEALWLQLQTLGCRLPSFHTRAARLLYQHPKTHLRRSDAVSLLSMEYPAVDTERLAAVIADLARWGIVQRIEVDGKTFLDTNTKPHLHTYRATTGELEDAPGSGVLFVG